MFGDFVYLFVYCLGICLVAFPVGEELFSWEHWGALQQPLTPVPRGHGCSLPFSLLRHPACCSHPEIAPTTHRHTSSACLPCVHACVQQLLLGIRSQAEAPCFSLSQNEMGRHWVPLQSPAALHWSSPELPWDFVCPCSERCLVWRHSSNAQRSQSLPTVGGTEPLVFFR